MADDKTDDKTDDKKPIPPEVSAFFAKIGRKNGNMLMKKHGSDYFKRISAMRKTHGRQGKVDPKDNPNTYRALADVYNVSYQRIQQIVKQHGQKLVNRSEFDSEASWRGTVVKEYFSKK